MSEKTETIDEFIARGGQIKTDQVDLYKKKKTWRGSFIDYTSKNKAHKPKTEIDRQIERDINILKSKHD